MSQLTSEHVRTRHPMIELQRAHRARSAHFLARWELPGETEGVSYSAKAPRNRAQRRAAARKNRDGAMYPKPVQASA